MQNKQFSQLPKAYESYPAILKKLLLTSFKKNQLSSSHDRQLPQLEYQVVDFQVDVKHLRHYLQLCDFTDNGTIPAIYLLVLAQSLQMQMMSQKSFPFNILGLVHIANDITQYRPIYQHEHLNLSCQFGELQPHSKGTQFQFIITVKINDEVVMIGKTTYLSRHKTTYAPLDNHHQANQPTMNDQPQAIWHLAENLGRQYALNSGDFNLIHLHAKTAQLFGFKQAIIHGMWSNAKALASVNLFQAYEMNTQFKLPIFLPATVELLTHSTEKNHIQVLLQQKDSHKPHMVMHITSLEQRN